MKILFISRCYPPIIGGMEKVSLEITAHLANITSTCLIANRRGKKNLPFFLPYALFKALYLIKTHSIDIVHLSDGLLAPLGVVIKAALRIPVVSTVHGLDVTYSPKAYQRLISASLKKLDKLVCISSHTQSECLSRGIPPSKCKVIPNGINPEEFYLADPETRKRLQEALRIDLAGKFILLSVGHLVARKGIPWFIRQVFSRLDKNTVYLVIGGYGNASRGNEKSVYTGLIEQLQLTDRVFLLGEVSHDILKLAYNSADLLIMPNIKVPGDMEGFGMVALEAASCGLPVVASKLEGITEAVKEGKNGFLIEPQNSQGYIKAISGWHNRPGFRKQVREYTLEHYKWDKIIARYYRLFQEICQ